MKNNVFLCRLVIRLHPSIFVDHDIDCGVPTGDSFFGDELGFFPKKLFTHMKCQCKWQFATFLLRHYRCNISRRPIFCYLISTPCRVATGCGSMEGSQLRVLWSILAPTFVIPNTKNICHLFPMMFYNLLYSWKRWHINHTTSQIYPSYQSDNIFLYAHF